MRTYSGVPRNTSQPSISGAAVQGQTLTASVGEWAGRTPMRYTFQWQRAGASIVGANGSTYELGASDVGFTLDVIVTASNAAGSASATSAATPVVVGSAPLLPPPPGATAVKFIGSIDTMKLSKDLGAYGFTTSDGQAVDLAASTGATHITDDVQLEYPATLLAWANRIHTGGKSVWFRMSVANGNVPHGDEGDGYPTFAAGYLTKLHQAMIANPSLFRPGDLIDGDAEAENSMWWASHYGCGVQQTSCAVCNEGANNKPCAPVPQFNHFLTLMTEQENRDLSALGITPCATPSTANCVLTEVHSTDPGTAIHQLSNETVKAMGNLITVDAYPDQSTTDPGTAASSWTHALQSWESAWIAKGISPTILIGEWGYSNTIDVTDVQQHEVVAAETKAFATIPYLLGVNYWVGPGSSHDGGYTNIFVQESGAWKFRPAAGDVSLFYAAMNGETLK